MREIIPPLQELQGEYARALIAVDQLRVAKYLAHGKKHSEKVGP